MLSNNGKLPPPPEPFTDADIAHKFWKAEPFDDCLPKSGWLTDLIYAARGIETPTSFTLWAGIWSISSVLMRDAFHKFELLPPLYPNIYVILAGPPRILGKSTILGLCVRIIKDSIKHIHDERTHHWKKPNIVHSRSTGEALITNSLDPNLNPGYTASQSKSFVSFPARSQCAIYASDLPTCLGKQKYNLTLINQLIDLYDCKDHDEINTISRGRQELHNICVTLAGAATYEQLAKNLPPSAFGDGFLSRCVIIARAAPTRIYPKPVPVVGAPNQEQLAARLAWIQQNAAGPYSLSEKADKLYQEVYLRERHLVLRHLDDEKYAIRFRFDVNLLKLAMIFRASRYEAGRTIQEQDILDADQVLQRTLETSKEPLSGVGDDAVVVARQKLEHRIQARGQYSRVQALKSLSRDAVRADDVSRILTEMKHEGLITVWRPVKPGKQLKKCDNVSSSVREVYRWVNGSSPFYASVDPDSVENQSPTLQD